MADIAGAYQLGPSSGRVVIKTSRAGLAARAGHDLTIEVTKWSASVTVPADGELRAATIEATLDLGSLAVREGTGGARPLTDKDRRDIEASMAKVLPSSATATYTSSRIIPSSVGGAIEGTLTLDGKSAPLRLQVSTPAPGRYRGSATVAQTALGITPYSGFFGTLKLRDEVVAEFDLDLTKAQSHEPPPAP
jgi:polyisoprenoid-binding protein YceI